MVTPTSTLPKDGVPQSRPPSDQKSHLGSVLAALCHCACGEPSLPGAKIPKCPPKGSSALPGASSGADSWGQNSTDIRLGRTTPSLNLRFSGGAGPRGDRVGRGPSQGSGWTTTPGSMAARPTTRLECTAWPKSRRRLPWVQREAPGGGQLRRKEGGCSGSAILQERWHQRPTSGQGPAAAVAWLHKEARAARRRGERNLGPPRPLQNHAVP